MTPFPSIATVIAVIVATGPILERALGQEGEGARGGGPGRTQEGPCILPHHEARIHKEVATFLASQPASLALPPPAGSAPYPFYPQAGKLWEDLFPNNFVDLEPTSPGILDYHGTAYTYNGHRGIDSDLCTFTEQSVGVPVFAVLDGVVTAAHDGEFDMNTASSNAPANYVILRHGGTHDTWYYHLKQNSVAVTVGQPVKAGQQLGLTASSGNSTGPHLHFQSQYAGATYEAFTGPSNPGTSGWVSQPAFRTEMYVRDFNVTSQNLSSWAGPPIDTTRTGTFVGTGVKATYFWALIHSLPAASTYRIRYLRPNGTQRYDSGTIAFQGGNPFYKWSYWWWNYNINFDVTGTWTLEVSVNGAVVVNAPILLTTGAVTNRPPVAVMANFDPAVGYASRAMFCRVPFHLIDDPDYHVVRYRFLWKKNGMTVRDSTNAGLADALAAGTCAPGDVLTCAVTPSDGIASPATVTATTTLRQTFSEWAASQGIAGASPSADADLDGLANAVEYFLNLSGVIPSVLPLPTRNPSTGVMSWQIVPAAFLDPLLTHFVDTSTDLATWTVASADTAANTWSAGGFADSKRFMRLRIVLPN